MPHGFALIADVVSVAKGLACSQTVPEWPRRYRVQPNERMPVCIQDSRGRRVGPMRWGWHRDQLRGRAMTTGRAEIASGKPELRAAFARRRCVIPMTAWYEFTKLAGFPMRWTMRDLVTGTLFVGGLWEVAKGPGGLDEGRFLVLTVPSLPMIAKINARMPLLLPAFVIDDWLNSSTTLNRLRSLAVPYQYEALDAYQSNPVDERDEPAMLDRLEAGD